MRLLKFFVTVIFCFGFINVVQAKDITLEDIYNELKLVESEITDDIYNSEVNYENNKISIKYTFKDNSSSETYFNPEKFITELYGDVIITYKSGGNKLRKDDGYLPNENDKNITQLIKTEEKWFKKLIDILNKLTNNKFSEYSLSKTKFCDNKLGLCVINAGTGVYEFTNKYDILYWHAQFRLNKKLFEIENITETTANLVYYNLHVDGLSSAVCTGSNITIVDKEGNKVNDVEIKKASNDLDIYNIKFSNLKPNTKYIYNYENECNTSHNYDITFTTLANTIIDDKENINNNTSVDKNTNENINKNNNIDNPQTGNKLPLIIISSLIVIGIIINRYTKKNNKLY